MTPMTKKFTRISLNQLGDMTEMNSFSLVTPEDKSLNFIKNPDALKIKDVEYKTIQISYDSRGNWIRKLVNNETVIRRKIVYSN